jgi:hypothetical protein
MTGIFGVFMLLIYSEGQDYAIKRLEEEINKRSMNRLQQHAPPSNGERKQSMRTIPALI